MQLRSIEQRLRILEEQMQALKDLPAAVTGLELQILQLRTEMREGFSSLDGSLRAEIRAGDEETRNYMRMVYEDLIARIAIIGEGRT